ncbi:alcohol-forming fatty acyl-CoA reductase-like [Gossypium australe]|uniref:Alcohol-forming fatty acyl-CoA reductase-like n=1 Tax=Gossypium australe TaxID=47621 RepID=A0A5B6W610_9ROSI|nr:alcohol-forming fatty acyl-CoA reductase-like [Gossypium australe]
MLQTNISSTHSYVAKTISENLGNAVECTVGEITVLSLLGQSVRRRGYLSDVISTLVAEKLVQKGCEAYLTYISVSIFGDSSIRDIRTVREFSDIFSMKLSSLPPNQEVGFDIELLLGTAPVSIASYRMALKEVTELKVQLQELLDRRSRLFHIGAGKVKPWVLCTDGGMWVAADSG